MNVCIYVKPPWHAHISQGSDGCKRHVGINSKGAHRDCVIGVVKTYGGWREGGGSSWGGGSRGPREEVKQMHSGWLASVHSNQPNIYIYTEGVFKLKLKGNRSKLIRRQFGLKT